MSNSAKPIADNRSPIDDCHDVRRIITSLYPRIVALRRDLHMHPELSGSEHRTARLVFDRCKTLGLKPRFFVGSTGVAAKLTTGIGPSIVLRADLDALPIQELNTVPYHSRVPGAMHACGHDMHTAILLGAAEALLNIKDQFAGTVTFLFQPSEERSPGGARVMLREGAFPAHADAVFGLHVNPEYAAGQVALASGVDYAGVCDFDLAIRGKGGHGATPDAAIDPIVCAASVVARLKTITSRRLPLSRQGLISVGSLHAGSGYNIIPDVAHVSGTIRAYSDAFMRRLMRRVKRITESGAHAFGAHAGVTFVKGYPPLRNNPVLALQARKILGQALGTGQVIMRKTPVMYAEDFAYYAQRAPGLFIHLGVRNPSRQTAPGIHNARFLPDERAIRTGMLVHCALTLGMLGPEQNS